MNLWWDELVEKSGLGWRVALSTLITEITGLINERLLPKWEVPLMDVP